MPDTGVAISEAAPAKVNLTLHILGRRADGYHALESLVAFAETGDRLTLTPGHPLAMSLRGPMAGSLEADSDNLVLRAAHALGRVFPGLETGRFSLTKRLPVAAGIGGGSSDAAAALRLLARANRIAPDDPRLFKVARSLGADVPVCLDPQARLMRGIGERLSAPIDLPRLPAVLVNPGVSVSTADVFRRLNAPRGVQRSRGATGQNLPGQRADLIKWLGAQRNDLEAPALALVPSIERVLRALRRSEGCRLARMSGSGATCFGLFDSQRAAREAAQNIAAQNPRWWVQATVLS